MRMFLILPILYFLFGGLLMPERLAARSFTMQRFCSDLFVDFTFHQDLASAFICGSSIDNIFAREVFQQTGLIHLMVVSGSHLIFLSHLLSFLANRLFPHSPRTAWLVILALMFYSFMTGFQPPVVRSLCGVLIGRCNHFFRWGWSHHGVQCFASLLLLSLNPPWILSLSFYLSWFASTGLHWAPLFLRPQTRQKKSWKDIFLHHSLSCLLIQASLTLLTFSFSWISFVSNLLIAPFLSALLFPILTLSLLLPGSQNFLDHGWDYLLITLQRWAQISPSPPVSFPRNPPWIWLALLISLYHFFRRSRYEKSAV